MILYCFYLCQQLQAQTVHNSPVYHVPAGTYSRHFKSPFTLAINPAAIGGADSATVGLHSETKFLLEELSTSLILTAFPLSLGNLGLQIGHFGFSEYSESNFALAYALQLGNVDLGIKFSYTGIQTGNYGKAGVINANIGLLWQLADHLMAGFSISNIAGDNFKRHARVRLARLVIWGIGYEFSEQFYASLQVRKDENRLIDFEPELQYRPSLYLFLGCSLHTNAASGSFFAGWRWNHWRTDLVFNYHLQLGVTPGISLIYYGKKKRS